MRLFLIMFLLLFFLTDTLGMDGKQKKFSKQQSNVSSASSYNPIDEVLGNVAKKFKNLLNKSKNKAKDVGRNVSEVIHRGGWKII